MVASMEYPTTTEPIRVDRNLDEPARRVVTLGSVRHRDAETNEIILIPTPSNDPNDPLNWCVANTYDLLWRSELLLTLI